ncbi:hypothetical protein LRR18_05925 [Mangrovimonas sp. AS39]|uniref:hypothetical protein n=1 Tax=Mangrovimonas futianensis TaxID=2895523 RepID=UPI001E5B4B36|nr:hypothetical protein [Mangrovimonas futianensis]MCF1191117.1 hypothetical protein [Mangrovimonas futianensis]MCF1194812.1 hypothetical protein [Mangrovimonas futianensis]
MKKLVILLSLMVFACSSDDDNNIVPQGNNEPQEDTLIGTWKLIEFNLLDHNTSETQWWSVPEWISHTYSFNADFTVTQTGYDCEGTYENDPADYLVRTFDCPGFPNPDIQEYIISFDNHNLILAKPDGCDEVGACASKYEKVVSN